MEKAKKVWEWIKNNSTIIFIVAIAILSPLAVIVGPMILDENFSKPACNKWFEVNWQLTDALNYYGAALAFCGTALFSGLALWQNHVFKKANEKHEKLLEQFEQKKLMPMFECVYVAKEINSKRTHLFLRNVSDNKAFSVQISDYYVKENNKWTKLNMKKSYIGSIDQIAIPSIWVDVEDITQEKEIRFKVSFIDRFGESHFYIFESYKITDEVNPFFKTKGIDKE